VPEPAAAVGTLAVLANHALQAHQAGVPEQVRPISPCSKGALFRREVQNSRRTALVRIPDSIGQFGTSERCQNGTQGRTDDCISWSSIL
jgi:hypothetical protein